jgi:hypothetical protein
MFKHIHRTLLGPNLVNWLMTSRRPFYPAAVQDVKEYPPMMATPAAALSSAHDMTFVVWQ